MQKHTCVKKIQHNRTNNKKKFRADAPLKAPTGNRVVDSSKSLWHWRNFYLSKVIHDVSKLLRSPKHTKLTLHAYMYSKEG